VVRKDAVRSLSYGSGKLRTIVHHHRRLFEYCMTADGTAICAPTGAPSNTTPCRSFFMDETFLVDRFALYSSALKDILIFAHFSLCCFTCRLIAFCYNIVYDQYQNLQIPSRQSQFQHLPGP
jgi:hypothetical protein